MYTSRTAIYRCVQHAVCRRGFLPQKDGQTGLNAAPQFHTQPPQQNSNRTSVVRYGRQKYERLYPVLLVQPDGSTINIRYKEPRRVLMLPLDASTLTDEERKARLKRREPKKKTMQQDSLDYKDDFTVDQYSQFWKKK
ncbi:large ribosomal subunit protein mL55 [Aplochiton taeniatus]